MDDSAAWCADVVQSQTMCGKIVVDADQEVSGGAGGTHNNMFFTHEKVWVRSHDGDPWQPGFVVDAAKALVRLEKSGEGTVATAWRFMQREAPPDDQVLPPARESTRKTRGLPCLRGPPGSGLGWVRLKRNLVDGGALEEDGPEVSKCLAPDLSVVGSDLDEHRRHRARLFLWRCSHESEFREAKSCHLLGDCDPLRIAAGLVFAPPLEGPQ